MAHWASFKVVRTRVVRPPTMTEGPEGTGYQLGVLFGDTVGGAPAEKREERTSSAADASGVDRPNASSDTFVLKP